MLTLECRLYNFIPENEKRLFLTKCPKLFKRLIAVFAGLEENEAHDSLMDEILGWDQDEILAGKAEFIINKCSDLIAK